MKIPELNKTYNCFDDGKITLSRLYTVDVIAIIPFGKIDAKTLNEWKERIEESPWLFAKETDYFIKTINGEDGDATFVRTIDNRWFSIGSFMNSGLLDIDGSLTKQLKY